MHIYAGGGSGNTVDKLGILRIDAMATGRSTRESISSSSLEYDAEVAYVVSTSHREERRFSSQSTQNGEFDFAPSEPRTLINRDNEEAGDLKGGAVVSATRGDLDDSPTLTKRDHFEADEDSPTPKLFPETQSKTLVVYGPSGCGKTHLVRKLAGSHPSVFSLTVSHTTRKRREGEINGVDFHFVSRRTMLTQIAQGHFIENIQINQSKPVDVTGTLQAASVKFESVFDLTEEDSITVGGELFGTSRQAFQQAIHQGKPCVLLNVSSRGSHQLKEAGIKGCYILLRPGKTSEPLPSEELQPDYVISTDNLESAFSELKQYAFHAIQELPLPPSSKQQLLKQEWDSIPTVEMGRGELVQHPSQKLVTFSELLTHFQNANLSEQVGPVEVEQHKSGIARFFSRSKLAKRLHYERLLVFRISLCPLNDREPLHLRTLQTIYRKLTGTNLNVRRFGSHWEEIGFQGTDPADDIRGVGFLGLMQLMYFLDNHRTLPLAREICGYSREKDHYVPFCVLSFNITQIALSALREGYLSKICNKRDQVFVVVNEFHTAVFYRYYQIWKGHSMTVLDVGPLIQKVGEFSKKNAKQILSNLEEFLAGKEQQSLPPPRTRQQSPQTFFTPFDQIRDSVVVDPD